MQEDAPSATPPVPITVASRTSYQHRHQRSYSHSSLSRGDTTESHAHQPVRSPLSGQLSTSQPGSSVSNQYKRNSDSSRTSFKEGVANGSGSNSPSPLGRTSGSRNNSPVGARQSQQPQQRPGILRHHSSFSKLSGSSTAVSTSSSTSSNAEKSWSPNMGHGSNGGMVGLPAGLVSGGTTLFEVMADDPFGGMTFVSFFFAGLPFIARWHWRVSDIWFHTCNMGRNSLSHHHRHWSLHLQINISVPFG